jgi:hypothetical protein
MIEQHRALSRALPSLMQAARVVCRDRIDDVLTWPGIVSQHKWELSLQQHSCGAHHTALERSE